MTAAKVTMLRHETDQQPFRPSLLLYVAVGAVAGAIIALQIGVMRLFAVGSWAHFGSLVVSLAMLAFGWASALMCVTRGVFERRWFGVCAASLLLFGPLAVGASLVAQRLPFNAVFIVSDPAQKWRLFANFLLYFLPFLAGAFFLGTVFLKAKESFNRFYFADLVGSGLCGIGFLLATYLLLPENLILAPLAMWAAGTLAWFAALGARRALIATSVVAALTVAAHLGLPPLLGTPKLAVSDYKGVSYVRKFPDAARVYENVSPFGHLEVYSSSYLHFAPGLSDNAAFNLPEMPKDAFLGLYIDGEGPSGIIRDLPAGQLGYFRFLPLIYPYLIRPGAETAVAQFGGGLSTAVALHGGASPVTVAEGNPEVLRAFRTDPTLKSFTGDILANPKVRVIPEEGRLYLAHTPDRFDIIDLSLADSAGLSNPGGFAIVEKYAYTREAMESYMRALKPGGVLSVTLWNKEEPPKSVLKLYATMAEAARAFDPAGGIGRNIFVVSSYLSTATVLYRQGGFTEAEIKTLRDHTRAMSFDEVYYPGMTASEARTEEVLEGYRSGLFFDAAGPLASDPAAPPPGAAPPSGEAAGSSPDETLPSTVLGRVAWQKLVSGGWDEVAAKYVFDTRALTNDRPYFAAYVKPADLPRVTDRLELLQDEWGYLLIWATLGIAAVAALSLVLLPVAVGWRLTFARSPGKALTIVYFACLGLGYIMVEIGMIAAFNLGLGNPTISVTILITGMLTFSGLGALVSERMVGQARVLLPLLLVAVAACLVGYAIFVDRAMEAIGSLPYAGRLAACVGLIAPAAFLMGFPMPVAMSWLTRLEKTNMFVWAWGINGSFSVLGAAAVPVVATSFGLHAVLLVAAAAYLVAIPAFFGILLPPYRPQPSAGPAWA